MGHLKLKDGTTFPLTLSVGDIRDISKRSGAFSKTITLVGDEGNNNLLNHYYDVNVVAGTFDINKLQACQIIQNGIVILDNAYMQLIEVVKSQTTDAHNQQIEYKVLVKDSVSDFFTKIGNKMLSDINIQDIVLGTGSLTYTSSDVISSFSNTIADGYKFTLPYDDQTNNEYALTAMHPSIYAKLYFDSIFNAAGFTYEWGNQSPFVHTTNNNYFEKLVIPYNAEYPKEDQSDYLVEATKGSLTTSQTGLDWVEQITGFTEVTDAQSIFDPVNGDYSVPFYASPPQNIQIEIEYNIDVDITNNTGALATRNGAATKSIHASCKKAGSFLYATAEIASVDMPLAITALTTVNLLNGYTGTVTIPISNLTNSDILEFFVRALDTTAFYNQLVDIDVTINSSTWKIIPSAQSNNYQLDINFNDYIPKKVKQSDFVKSIFMMYNLYAEVDSSQPNKLILKHRDEYYDSGTEIDWTDKLAKDKDQTLQFLPELSAKKMVLSYKDDNDSPNVAYKDATNETYGQVEYTFENEYVRGIDRKELIFSPTPHAMNSHNAIVPLIGYAPEVNVRILIDGGTQTCGSYTIVDYWSGSFSTGWTANGTTTTTAPVLTHFDDPITPTFDINFAVCDYYFYSELATKTNNNLYNLYWRRTLGQIDKGKMLTAYFDLNEVDIQSLKLNDKIRIDNSWWHINRVIDYDANERKLTKVELISVDEEIEFTPFATTPTVPVRPNLPNNPTPVKPTKPEIVRPVKDIVKKNTDYKNLSTGNIEIKGINNFVQPGVKKAIVVGDGLEVEEDGIHTEKLFINGVETTGNFANTDLTFTGNRTHDLDSNSLIVSADGATLNNEWLGLGSGLAYLAFDDDYVKVESNKVGVYVNAINRLETNATETVINESGGNYDTRIEGQTDKDLFFVDASTDRVGIGTNSPAALLDVATDISVGDSASVAQTVVIEGSRSSLPTTSDAYAGIFNVTGSGSWSASDRGDLHLHPRLSAERSVVMWTYDGSTVAKRFEVSSKGNVICGEKTALATTATDGFTYIPSGAGTPTGTPTSVTGKVPMYYDDTNQVLYIYSGGVWNAH